MDAVNEIVRSNVKFSRPKGSPGHGKRDRQYSDEARAEIEANSAVEAAWAKILSIMENRDDKLVTGWRDEMNNLLIFAGLFSAVVTAFAAVALQSLQQDDTQTSVQLLAGISRQLASFTVTPEFVNSTAPNVDPSAETFEASALAVQVNTLWFLSLALSLIAALFAIVVQQWVREYPVSGMKTLREILRVRHYRYKALNAWGVPHVVSILPILLQVALVLFLVGLAQLLWSLNRTVALPFIIFLAVSGGFLCFTTLIPAISTSCPYKSPLAEIVILVVRSCLHISSLAIKILAFTIIVLAILIVTAFIKLQHMWTSASLKLDYQRQRLLNHLTRILVPSTWPFSPSRDRRLFSEYWSTCDEDVGHNADGLDQEILIWAPSALPSNQWHEIHACFRDRTRDEVIECVSRLVTQSFNVSARDSPNALRYPASTTLRSMDRLSVQQCREQLFLALTKPVEATSLFDRRYPRSERLELDANLVLYFLMCAEPRPSPAERDLYLQSLIDGRRELRALGSCDGMLAHGRLRTVTSALLECSTAWEHRFSLEDTALFSSWASDVWTRVPVEPAQFWIEQACSEEFLGTMALGLYAMEPHAPTLPHSREAQDCCQSLLHCLDIYTSTNSQRLRALAKENMSITFANEGLLAAACTSICRSLSVMAPDLTPNLDDLAQQIAHRLAETIGDLPGFFAAVQSLNAFQARMNEKSQPEVATFSMTMPAPFEDIVTRRGHETAPLR